MIRRQLEPKLLALARGFPVVSLTGPRQSGKTTLVRAAFPEHAYLNLENLDTRMAAAEDPRRFLRQHLERGAIIDEAQKVPELFSYLQEVVDSSGQMGQFILTGSHNFLLLESITQTLAGRTSVQHLLPFDLAELAATGRSFAHLDDLLYSGLFPPLYDRPVAPGDFYPAYLETYVERDVRAIRNIGDLALFRKFLLLCAGRVGQLLNLSSLGNELGIDHKTVRVWISILEASFVVFLLQPHHQNWNKRLVKQPKLYFHDTGLLCALLGLESPGSLASHHLRGSLVENLVITDAIKQRTHRGQRPAVSFWRDHSGHEVDLIIERDGQLRAVEIKSAETLNSGLFDGLRWFQKHSGIPREHCALIYGGTDIHDHPAARVLGWPHIPELASL